jgi:hypothetical protein
MKLTENTKVKIRVPKHLYEAIQAQLDKKETMDEAEEGNSETMTLSYNDHPSITNNEQRSAIRTFIKFIKSLGGDAKVIKDKFDEVDFELMGVSSQQVQTAYDELLDAESNKDFLDDRSPFSVLASWAVDAQKGNYPNSQVSMEEGEETMEEDSIEEKYQPDVQKASVEEIAVAMDKAVVQAKKRAQEIAKSKGGKLTQSDFFSVIDKFRSKIKEFGPFKRVAEPEEMEEALDLKTLMEAVSAATKKKKIADKIADKKAESAKEKEAKIAADKKVKETKEKAEAAAAKKKAEAAKKK